MLKSLGGPITAFGLGLSPVESTVLSSVGMLLTATLVAFGGERVRAPIARFLKRVFPKQFDRPMHPGVLRIFERYGMAGIAFITPLFLSPPGGAVAAVVFQVERKRVVSALTIAGVVWSVIYTAIIYTFAEWLTAHGILHARHPG